ncbi:MAG TPA: ligase-associated DNA damage response DEXH box helicase [Acidiphilium sp.]|uniref:ligase-associated DNA damage response DEXH box helicase n=1 Tax=unclassified Acidiphilium TaxID=2617493 RepID=UPI000BD42307|nr:MULTISPECIES: ligase-associated DNA damage response DEXH box helicase [unclassified Acidiphilium]OYV57054.1 MAG: DNA ligase-associated DEXH box helicase [Acidiphilium sp. 20-67-58]HQT61813.1 ligase-associated DNA damage response DEXH box helicase [Acidiphilium sp.]HQU12285.1 ligase-associated DNA damage response DEXH box helicase [Acidiphilium sp.]
MGTDCRFRQVCHVWRVTALPPRFADWFAARGWTPRPHQLAVLGAVRRRESALLIAPTGGGKTLAGFLPSLIALAEAPPEGLHTIYVSPLKALATDIARNLEAPVAEMGLPIRIETRTGDTPANRRARQRARPPHILLTTPESLALLLYDPEAASRFAGLASIVIDEVHALAGTKRGDQLALCLARLARLAPGAVRIGLSATIAHPAAIRAWVSPDGKGGATAMIAGEAGAAPEIGMLIGPARMPWSGHMGLMAAAAVLARIREARMTIVFVNTRAQAELMFEALWKHNEETLPIALHHGSLAVEQRRRVEAAMAGGKLRAVVATSSLDLGIDWAGVDQVIQIGAPKGVSRLLQRLGRANHRLDEASRALLVPANRFEVLECAAAIEGVAAQDLDGDPPRPGGLDVLAQHVLGCACAASFHPDDLFAEITEAAPYAALAREDFDQVVRFVEDGGYALAVYERYRRLFRDAEGVVHVRSEAVARRLRMNIGTIVEAPVLKVRLGAGRGGAVLGEVEEYFAAMLAPGDTFRFAGRLLRFIGIRETSVLCAEGGTGEPKIPAYVGGRMPLSTNLADRVRLMLHTPATWDRFPEPVREWLGLQAARSALPAPDDLLVETFPRGGRWYLVAYCFEGRQAHQALGMLLTRRLERLGFQPLGYVATDYVLGIWCAREPTGIGRLFEEDLLGEDLEAWMAESSMLRRSFRNVAVIAGLIERVHPGGEKNRRQITVNTDLIYDVLRKHDPSHILLRATWADAAHGLVDLARIAGMLARARGRVHHRALPRVSPLAVPVLLEIGRERVGGAEAEEALLGEAEALVAEAMGTGTLV